MPKLNPKKQKHKRGVAAVEAALVLPIVVLLTFGFVEIGWQVNSIQVLHDAARQGARAAVRLENSNAEVLAAVVNSLSDSIDVDPSAVTVRISKLNSAGEEDYQVMNLNENEQGHAIRVTVTVDSSQFRPPSDFLGITSRSLNSSAVMQRLE